MTERRSDDPMLLLHAALDGELDAAGAMEVEARLAADPALAAEYARLVALRNAIGTRLPLERAPDALRARVIAMAQAPSQTAPSAPRRSSRLVERYLPLAATLILGVVLGAGGYGLLERSSTDDDVQRAVVASFIRGRLSGQTVDIATSDRHTVKPWFAGKIAGATTVVDLKADGFPLVGGRIDVVGKMPVADPRLSAPRAPDRPDRNAGIERRTLERASPRNARRLFAARMDRRRTSLCRRIRSAAGRTRRFRRRIPSGGRRGARRYAKTLSRPLLMSGASLLTRSTTAALSERGFSNDGSFALLLFFISMTRE